MSLPVRCRPLARLELDDAMGWYEKQKHGLGSGRFRPTQGEVRRFAAFLTQFISWLSRTPLLSSPSSTPSGIHGISKAEVDHGFRGLRGSPLPLSVQSVQSVVRTGGVEKWLSR